MWPGIYQVGLFTKIAFGLCAERRTTTQQECFVSNKIEFLNYDDIVYTLTIFQLSSILKIFYFIKLLKDRVYVRAFLTNSRKT